MRSPVDLKRLALFRQVVECGGLSAAEAVLDVNLPTISAHLARLESSLGVRLCERGRRGFRLTPQGQSVLTASERLFESIETFRSAIGEVSREVSGSLRVGIADSTISDPRCPLLPALRALRRRSRDLEITIDVRNPVELERALRDERLDLAIGPFNITDPEIVQIPTHVERLSLYVGEGHPLFDKSPLGLPDLAGADYVMRGYLRESQVAQQRVSFNYCAVAHSLEGIAQLLLTGFYVGYLPEHYAAGWVRGGRLRRVLPRLMSYDVSFKLAVPRHRRRGGATAALIEIVRETVESRGRSRAAG